MRPDEDDEQHAEHSLRHSYGHQAELTVPLRCVMHVTVVETQRRGNKEKEGSVVSQNHAQAVHSRDIWSH